MKGSPRPTKQPQINRFDSKYAGKMNVHTENAGEDFLKKFKKKKKK